MVNQAAAREPRPEPTHGDIMEELREFQRELREFRTEVCVKFDSIEKRLLDGDRRMNEQDKAFLFQAQAIRLSSQLRELHNRMSEGLVIFEQLETNAIERIRGSESLRPSPDQITRVDNPVPDPEENKAPTIPAPPDLDE